MSAADYVEETTTSIAGTNGNGAVTLSAQGNYARFSSAFGTGTRAVDYVMERASDGWFEVGRGTVASNVLTRTTPRITWNGTTYDDTAPAALQFGSSPTAGAIRIRIAPISDGFFPVPPAMRRGTTNHRFASGSNAYLPSAHFVANNFGSAGTTSVTTLEYYEPFLNLGRGRLVGFGVNVATAVAASQVKLGLYEVGPDGFPGPCITQSGAISTAATGLAVDETAGSWLVNVGPLRPGVGWFYLARQFSAAGVALTRMPINNAGQLLAAPPLGMIDAYGWAAGLTKTNENSFATGLPTGTPTGTYTVLALSSGIAGSMQLLSVENS